MKALAVLLAVVVLFFGGIAPALPASDLASLTGWYKTDKNSTSRLYIGVFDKETCQRMLKIGPPGVCIHLTFTEGAGAWWNVVRAGNSVLLSGPWLSEKECKPHSTSEKCVQAKVQEEAP